MLVCVCVCVCVCVREREREREREIFTSVANLSVIQTKQTSCYFAKNLATLA